MSRKYRLRIIAISTLLSALGLTGGLAHAAPQAITISPTSVDKTIKPGAAYNGNFQVLNQGKTEFTFKVYAAPYHVKGEDYTPDFTTLLGTPNVASWFKFSVDSAHITPGQSVNVNYSVNIPEGTPPGGYYATVFAQTQYPKQANSITLNERVGQIFYLQAAGPVAKKGEVASWQSGIFQKPPLTSTLRLQNDGGVHYPATIQVNVRDVFGRSKYSLHTSKEVLPQTIRKVAIPWNKTPGIGIFKVTGSVSFLNQHQELSTKWVFVMSQAVRICLGAVLLLIILFVAARSQYKRRRRRAAKSITKR
jgi:hypothetical protein